MPVHLYTYQKDLDMPEQRANAAPKRSTPTEPVESGEDVTSAPPLPPPAHRPLVNTIDDDELMLICHEDLGL